LRVTGPGQTRHRHQTCDHQKAKAAKKALSAAKKEIKTVIAQQTERFYEALCTDDGVAVVLRAPDGAAIGWASDAIRYVWTKNNPRKSNNFWIRWSPGKRFVVVQRVNSSPASPVLAEHSFDEDSVEHMIKCLVTGARIKPASLQPGKILFLWSRR